MEQGSARMIVVALLTWDLGMATYGDWDATWAVLRIAKIRIIDTPAGRVISFDKRSRKQLYPPIRV